MRYPLLTIILLFVCQLSAQDQDAELQSKVDVLNLKIEQSQNGERLKWMDSLTKVVRNNPELKYDSIVRQTIKFAITLDSLNLAANQVVDLIGFHNNFLGKPKEGLVLFNNYFEKLKDGSNFKTIGRLYLNAADSYYYTGNIDKSFEYYSITKDYALKANSQQLYGWATMYTGYNQSEIGEFAEASMSLKEASQIFTKLKDTSNILAAKNALGVLYSRNAFYEAAEKERNESLLLIGKTERYRTLTNLYYNAAEDNKRTGDFGKQLVNIKAAFLVNSKSKTAALTNPRILAQLVTAYAINDSISMAEKHFDDLNTLYLKNKSTELKEQIVKAKRILTFAKGDYKNSLKYGVEFLTILQNKNTHLGDVIMAEKFVANAYMAIGDSINHNKHLLNYYAARDSISGVQNVKSLAYYQTLYETEKRDLKIENQKANIGLLNLENKNKKQFLIFGSIGLVIFFCLIIVLRSRKNLKEMQVVQEVFSQNLISAREEERTTVARDLHDSVGQKLMLLTKITKANKNEELENLSSSSLEELRTVLRGLHPPAIKDLGITKAIESLVNEVDAHTDIFFTNDIENIDNILSSDNALHLYRIIQESLNNIVKHANAKATFVNIEKVKKQILVEIKDNGNGFDFSKNTKHGAHFGMKTLKERAKIIRSKLDIVSKHNQGTVIKLIIPI